MVHTDHSSRGEAGSPFTQDIHDFGLRARHYLRTRTLEHWLILAVGVIIGTIIG